MVLSGRVVVARIELLLWLRIVHGLAFHHVQPEVYDCPCLRLEIVLEVTFLFRHLLL